uniref:Uncharacterized protein n=1 Tax=Romanomermis culicivorax TaxID=13658 RepID=A0A915HVL6_ROMCU
MIFRRVKCDVNVIIGICIFLILLPAAFLLLASLFTHHWLEEKFEMVAGFVSYYLTHGLYEICSKKFIANRQVKHFSSILVLIIYGFLCMRCPSILVMFTLSAACCSCAVLVTFSMYHGTTYAARDSSSFFKRMVAETNFYGYSFWLAVGGCVSQFLASILLTLQTVSLCCCRSRRYSEDGEIDE